MPPTLAAIAASKFCKEVEDSASADGRFAIAVGYSKPEAVQWDKLKSDQGSYDLDDKSPLLINVLIDRKKDRALAVLPLKHFGTRRSYNHESLVAAWSEKGSHLIAMQSWKWHTEAAVLYRLDGDGRVTSQLDLLPVAKEQLRQTLAKKDAEAAKVFDSKYAVDLSEPQVNDLGEVSLDAIAEVPKSEDAVPVSLKIRFKAAAGADGKFTVSDLKAEEDKEE